MNKKILMISRPVDRYLKGTGISAVIYWLKINLESENFKLILSEKKFGIPPYHSIFSIIYYDFINPLYLSIKYRNANLDSIFFVDVSQTPLLFLIRLISKKNVPIVVMVADYFSPGESGTKLYSKYINLITRSAVKHADYIICTADENKEDLNTIKIPNQKSEIIILPLGLTINKVKNEIKLNLPENKEALKFGYLGSSHPRKRLDRIIQFADKCSEYKIKSVFVLGGNISSDFIENTKKFKKEEIQFIFLGNISEEQKVDFYSYIDCFFFPTELEGFGLPIIESFYYKKPCLVFNDSKIPQITKKNCMKLNPNYDNFKSLMMFLNERDSNEYKKHTDDNFNYSAEFNWKNYVIFFKNLI